MTELEVNGRSWRLTSAPAVPLLDVLRDELGLRGTRSGCREGVCGACRVLIDGRPMAACQTPLEVAHGHAVTTVEALPNALQEAFETEQAAQCGYCSAGMMVAASALLHQVADPSDAEIQRALDSQQCRCGAHPRIVRAVRRAARAMRNEVPALAGAESGECGVGEGPAADSMQDPIATPSAAPDSTPPLPAALQRHPRPAQWLALAVDGTLEVLSGKVEIGQGIQRALARIVSEELGWPLHRVRVSHPSTATHPDEGVTSGSLSVQDSGTALRCVAAAVRQRLCAAAAQAWQVRRTDVDLVDGVVIGPGGRAEAAEERLHSSLLQPPVGNEEGRTWRTAPATRPALRWHPTLTRGAIFRGQPHFIQDMGLPGLLHGAVLHPPGPLDRLAPQAPLTLPPDPQRITPIDVWRDGELIGLLGGSVDDLRRAGQALRAQLRWDPVDADGHAGLDPRAWPAGPSETRTVDERFGPALASDDAGITRLQASYSRAWLAHASVGPSCALARWTEAAGGHGTPTLEVWTHSQGLFGLRRDLALAFGRSESEVIVHHVPGAGCYGHNGADDVAFDAAWLAQRVPGRPVRCEWSRADDLARAPLGPAMCIELAAEVDGQGRVRQWSHQLWSPGHSTRPGRSPTAALLGQSQRAGGTPLPEPIDMPLAVGGGAERNAVPGYDFAAWRIVAHRVRTPWRSSALRSLGALGNVFAVESFIDEIARATGRDPLRWREQLLAHDPRALAVLRAAAARAGWDRGEVTRPAPDGETWGRGLGYARYKLTGAWCAVAAEVHAGATLSVRRLVVAADVGRVIDQDGAAMQLEGAALQATGFALKEAVLPGPDGRLPPESADAVPMLGFPEVPDVEVILLPSEAPSLGAGEAAIGPTAAAIANALTDALGVRVRDLPLTRERIVAAIQEQDP